MKTIRQILMVPVPKSVKARMRTTIAREIGGNMNDLKAQLAEHDYNLQLLLRATKNPSLDPITHDNAKRAYFVCKEKIAEIESALITIMFNDIYDVKR